MAEVLITHNQYSLAKLPYQHTVKPHPSSVLRLLCCLNTASTAVPLPARLVSSLQLGRLTGVGTQEVEPSRT